MTRAAGGLDRFGWADYVRRTGYRAGGFSYGRVAVENKGGYGLLTAEGELVGILRGKVLAGLEGSGFPKVGDWVRYTRLPNEDKAVVEEVLPRFSRVSRKAPSEREQEEQVIVANVDVVLVVQALPDDFSLRRLERYLAVARQGGARAVVVINKSDQSRGYQERVAEAQAAAPGVPVVAVSAKTGQGMGELRTHLRPATTFALLGSSGVGKSSLVNALLGEGRQATREISEYDRRGRHTTTRREMFLLADGSILVDTPGMRELSLWADEDELQESFADIDDLALSCKYTTCDHDKSDGCAVKAALDDGSLDEGRYRNFLKLRREAEYLASKADPAKLRERKRRAKGAHKSTKRRLREKY